LVGGCNKNFNLFFLILTFFWISILYLATLNYIL
jgi:hypothetical protein